MTMRWYWYRTHANGVPWLIWHGDGTWECEGCDASGRVPPFATVATFAQWLGDRKRAHAGCRPGGLADRVEGEIGDALNRDREVP